MSEKSLNKNSYMSCPGILEHGCVLSDVWFRLKFVLTSILNLPRNRFLSVKMVYFTLCLVSLDAVLEWSGVVSEMCSWRNLIGLDNSNFIEHGR